MAKIIYEEKYDFEDFAHTLGFKTLEELKNNFIDKGDYIEFIEPINNIKMMEKASNLTEHWFIWEEAMAYTNFESTGDFSDWRLPTIEELKLIYRLQNICGFNTINDEGDAWFWSSSTSDKPEYAFILNFCDGCIADFHKDYFGFHPCRVR
ncbi:DUF1566 domain-containing protein [bacterium]|nr:DUF1566 domain-containing protein [bacterium]